jgi:WASH complex subunit CCDC53
MQPQLDFTEVDPIPYRKSLTFVNSFLIQTTQFLNRFANTCEQKLSDVSSQLQQLEITMGLLEAKLASIPESALAPGAPNPANNNQPVANNNVENNANNNEPQPAVEAQPDENGNAGGGSGMTNAQDPRYAKYFKMLKNGVPLAAVQQKMMFEGFSPDVLSNPDGPSDFKEDDGPKDDEENDWSDEE